MAEERKGNKIKKWDEVNGSYDENPGVIRDSEEDVQMRGVEDLLEQNDNQLDGVINNLPEETVAEKEARTSVKEKLKFQMPEKEHKPVSLCPEMEFV